ncbi:hypothetical protein [Sporolactobacillus terrae]|uniref:Uncharacterized protein n=1 Tax=Sporolactobacillus terrae TaxID=269673 RepID=A0A410D8K3_9BACL|nr:hypothetical protein [Sporolactobacillus terrae]QAA22432.1 hypothetical protein C0674_07235 [Sporolactobacillus terrae]QAA25406.1 hypothetical protein C0679_07215 [Sporolactobacillus terrae]UAK17218.1 hypothetical protein K7399_04565 [Sporolactobacillus terrae]BBN98750.1 hypothetical protein St703_14550 [Sporolactobacillus terrae]
MKIYSIEQVLDEGLLTQWEAQHFSEGLSSMISDSKRLVGFTLISGQRWDVFKITDPILDFICISMETRLKLIEKVSN